jgi:predicted house-cleaning noncanonical NTP pyrophosphatase (MazG superfamily)
MIFFTIADNQYIIIQVDTLEINQTHSLIQKPQKRNNQNYAQNLIEYAQLLRQSVIDTINEWLQNHYQEKLVYAICIEEMESWILTIYTKKNTIHAANPKETLKYVLKGKFKEGDQRYYKEISKPFRKHKKLLIYSQLNESFKAFIESLSH